MTTTTRSPLVPGRWLVSFGMFLLALLLYIDRVCISVAKDPIADTLGLSDIAMGWVLSIFALGYAAFQVPGGMMADRWGPRKVLTGIVSFWSLLTALTGVAWNYVSLLMFRFLFGAGEAGAFPGLSRAIYSWIPLKERGLITGINFSGSRLGAAFALPLVAWLIDTLGWRSSFWVLGGIGLLWAVSWWFFFRDDPVDHSALSQAEKEYITQNRQQKKEQDTSQSLSFGQVLQSRNVWSIMLQYFASNFTFFFALTWLFPHLKSTYNLEAMEAGWYASAPLIGGAIGNWFAGWWVDHLYRNNKWTWSRRLPAIVGFSLAALGLLGSIYQATPFGAIFFLTIAIFGADMTLPPSWSICVDIGKSNAGMVSGTMNMAGNVGSFITALAFPYLMAWTQSSTYFFVVGAILNLVAVGLWLGIRADKPLVG